MIVLIEPFDLPKAVTVVSPLRPDRGKDHQSMWVFDWQGAEQRRIDQAENGGVRADAQRQREHGNQSEAGALPQHSRAVAQGLPKVCDNICTPIDSGNDEFIWPLHAA